MSGGVGNAGVLYGAPLFETGDPRYAWLNQVQAVFRGVVGADGSLSVLGTPVKVGIR